MPLTACFPPVRRLRHRMSPLRALGGAGLWWALTSLATAQGTVGPPGAKTNAAPATLSELFHAGGLMMYPLVALSVLAVALILFYTFSIRQDAVVSDRFMNEAETLLERQTPARTIGHFGNVAPAPSASNNHGGRSFFHA